MCAGLWQVQQSISMNDTRVLTICVLLNLTCPVSRSRMNSRTPWLRPLRRTNASCSSSGTSWKTGSSRLGAGGSPR
jgi:hypothetical protein